MLTKNILIIHGTSKSHRKTVISRIISWIDPVSSLPLLHLYVLNRGNKLNPNFFDKEKSLIHIHLIVFLSEKSPPKRSVSTAIFEQMQDDEWDQKHNLILLRRRFIKHYILAKRVNPASPNFTSAHYCSLAEGNEISREIRSHTITI